MQTNLGVLMIRAIKKLSHLKWRHFLANLLSPCLPFQTNKSTTDDR